MKKVSDDRAIDVIEPRYNWLQREGYVCSVIVGSGGEMQHTSTFSLTQEMVDTLLSKLKKYGSENTC